MIGTKLAHYENHVAPGFRRHGRRVSGQGLEAGPQCCREVSARQALFPLAFAPNANRLQYRYAPRPDGKQFLVLTDSSEAANTGSLTVVTNWLADVKK